MLFLSATATAMRLSLITTQLSYCAFGQQVDLQVLQVLQISGLAYDSHGVTGQKVFSVQSKFTVVPIVMSLVICDVCDESHQLHRIQRTEYSHSVFCTSLPFQGKGSHRRAGMMQWACKAGTSCKPLFPVPSILPVRCTEYSVV